MSITTQHPALSTPQSEAYAVATPLLVAVPDAARLLGIGTTLAWELVRAGDIASVKLGRRVLIPRAALERLAGVAEPQGQALGGSPNTARQMLIPVAQGRASGQQPQP